MGAGWRRWSVAMDEALYGPGGFYRASGAPAAHFRTAAHVSPLWARCWYELAARVAASLGRDGDGGPFTVVEMGAGGGELLAALAALAPASWQLVGVDVAPRPAGLPDRVAWADTPPEAFTGLAVAVEWLDVVPLDVVERTETGLRLVEVDTAGNERASAEPSPDDAAWVKRWWPLAEPGERAEVGRARDLAWQSFTDRLVRGVAVAVDYAVVPERDRWGTLAGYRNGRQVQPVPDTSCDLTAHVLFASLPAPDAVLLSQREALTALGLRAERPAYDGDARSHLAALAAAGAAGELLDPGGLGGFTWLVQPKGVPSPL